MAVFSGGGTGGHLYPALAVADALRRLRPDVRVVFVGARRGLEARVLPDRDEEHLLLPVRGFRRGAPLWRHLRVLPDLARSLGRAVGFLRTVRPEVVVVTGGYAGGPAGAAAALLGVPLVLQEQNAVPGLVTRTLSRWAREVHLAFPEARERLPGAARERARVSGNPVRPSAETDRAAARRRFDLPADGRIVLAVGGSQGSAALNEALVGVVRGVAAGAFVWPEGTHLLWATGPTHLADVKDALEGREPAWLRLTDYIDEMPAALVAADLAVSRAGAMATSEFLARGLPAILIPLPTSAAGHQASNARALDAAGAALHLPEEGLEPAELARRLAELMDAPDRLAEMARAAAARGRPRAADEIARAVAAYLPEPERRSGEGER